MPGCPARIKQRPRAAEPDPVNVYALLWPAAAAPCHFRLLSQPRCSRCRAVLLRLRKPASPQARPRCVPGRRNPLPLCHYCLCHPVVQTSIQIALLRPRAYAECDPVSTSNRRCWPENPMTKRIVSGRPVVGEMVGFAGQLAQATASFW